MSGDPLSIADITDLERFVEAIPALPPPHADAAPRDRGRAIFESAEAACQTCHSGSAYTSGATVDIGTRGGAFQVAVLLGVGYRAPYMHDGCARALREVVRGDDACRGSAHGRTSHLSDGDIDDLVTYLRSL